VKVVLIAATLLLGCSSAQDAPPPDAPPAASDAQESADAPPPPPADAAVGEPCAEGEVATYVAPSGNILCATITDATAIAVRSRCSVYLGQRDECSGCSDPPTKWTESDPLQCSPGEGAGNSCVTATLGDPAATVQLAALDLDGDFNGDDKLFAGLHCITVPRDRVPAPCAPGWAISGRTTSGWLCSPVSEAAVGYVRSHCAVYLGWTDNCSGCTSPPAKWGFANDAGCTSGTGGNDTCITATLAGETVNLFGLNTAGDVNDDDKFHFGLHCDPPNTTTTTATTDCPDGQFVVALNGDGSFECADPAAVFSGYLGDHCALYAGWHDSCDACSEAPTKWGTVSTTTCTTGIGTDDTCTEMSLGDANVPMFGLNPDGNVNGDDTLYFGLRCDL
jgi:hypothetical protein